MQIGKTIRMERFFNRDILQIDSNQPLNVFRSDYIQPALVGNHAQDIRDFHILDI